MTDIFEFSEEVQEEMIEYWNLYILCYKVQEILNEGKSDEDKIDLMSRFSCNCYEPDSLKEGYGHFYAEHFYLPTYTR